MKLDKYNRKFVVDLDISEVRWIEEIKQSWDEQEGTENSLEYVIATLAANRAYDILKEKKMK